MDHMCICEIEIKPFEIIFRSDTLATQFTSSIQLPIVIPSSLHKIFSSSIFLCLQYIALFLEVLVQRPFDVSRLCFFCSAVTFVIFCFPFSASSHATFPLRLPVNSFPSLVWMIFIFRSEWKIAGLNVTQIYVNSGVICALLTEQVNRTYFSSCLIFSVSHNLPL